MMQTYFTEHVHNHRAVFEVFFRKMPFQNGYAIYAGLQHVINYINNLHFTDDDIQYLKTHGEYTPEFLDYLRNFKFTGTVRSAEEGDLVYNHEPILQVDGTIAECQLVETAILNMVNYQTLIATKASRIRQAAGNDSLMEFGTRRAQETAAALWGTRAAYIGGFDSTSNVLAGQQFDIPVSGTHAHSMVETFNSEYDAFKAYAATHRNCVFLVDTYDTLKSGVPNAIRVAKELGDQINFVGVRIDSGDMAYLSKRVRQMLDDAGFKDTIIIASSGLDENTIMNLKMQDAKIDSWGVGIRLITAFNQPALGGVYKMVAVEGKDGKLCNTMKISDNVEKISTPGKKQVWRITEQPDGKSEGDYVALDDENPNQQNQLYMFHPQFTYVNKTLNDFKATPLLKTIFKDGEQVYYPPTLQVTREHAHQSLASLWPEYKRLLNPQDYPVDLSQRCWNGKMQLIKQIRQHVKNLPKPI